MRRLLDARLCLQAIKVGSGGQCSAASGGEVTALVLYALATSVVERALRLVLGWLAALVPTTLLTALTGLLPWARIAQPTLPPIHEGSQTAGERAELKSGAAELVRARGYPFEQHYAETSDGFLLGLHRIPHGKAGRCSHEPASPRPVVFLMHGLLQSSESFLCGPPSQGPQLAFQLADSGFDVWLGNARGNKYSSHHRALKTSSAEYWSFSLDDIAAKDLPAALLYVTTLTGQPSLSYVGFKQGTTVAVACLSSRSDIAAKVRSFVALVPAAAAAGCSQSMLDAIVKFGPALVSFLFGQRAPFGSVFYWWHLLSSSELVRAVDRCAFDGFQQLDLSRPARTALVPDVIERLLEDTPVAAGKCAAPASTPHALTPSPHSTERRLDGPLTLPHLLPPPAHPHSHSHSHSSQHSDSHSFSHSRSQSQSQSTCASPTPSQLSSLVGADDERFGGAFEGGMSALFAAAVLKRDGGRCVVCRSELALVAAHIVPLGCERTEAGLAAARLLHGFETANGLTLCAPCHAAWELGLWYISPADSRTLVVSQALPSAQPEWLQRVDGQAHTPAHFRRHWPSPRVLAVQQQFAEREWKASRLRNLNRLSGEGDHHAAHSH